SRPEARDDRVCDVFTAFLRTGHPHRSDVERNPILFAAADRERPGHDANDEATYSVEFRASADRRRVRGEPFTPEWFAEQNDLRTTGNPIRRVEQAPKHRAHPKTEKYECVTQSPVTRIAPSGKVRTARVSSYAAARSVDFVSAVQSAYMRSVSGSAPRSPFICWI